MMYNVDNKERTKEGKKMKQYVVRSANGNSKNYVFNTLDEAITKANKMNKTRKTPVSIIFGFVSENGSCIKEPEHIKY